MQDSNFADHLGRIRAAVQGTYGLTTLAPWIEKHTYLEGNRFSFKDHEFQKAILADDARTSVIVKCAQIGLSELAYRYAVAACCNVDDFTIIYTFPASADAERNCKTRIDPMIEGSPTLRRAVGEPNNSELKKFNQNSFIFFKGTFSATQALSTPANCIIHDEWDKSDTEQGSVYVSRLQHKPHKLRKIFSTPTIDKFGVSREAEIAQKMRMFAKCEHCNHWFLPDYFHNVAIPDFDGDMEEITRYNISKIRYQEAYVFCPKCGLNPNLHHERMQFVCENPDLVTPARAWYVTPFCAPNVITMSDVIWDSTQFSKYSEFKNQRLGLTAEDANDSILISDIENHTVNVNLHSSELHYMGCDMGTTCTILIGRIASDGTFLIVHKETCSYTQFEARTLQLQSEYRVVLCVMDSQPYTELVTRITKARPNHWGAIFTRTKTTAPFTLQEQDDEPKEGKMDLKLVKVNRNVALDELLGLVKSGKFAIAANDQDDVFKLQMVDMKRLPKTTPEGDLIYTWEKSSNGDDHYHFAWLYLWLAVQMRHTAGYSGALSASVPIAVKTKAPRYGVTTVQ